MVKLPAEYLWSSYRYNALAENDELLVDHELYERPGKTREIRCAVYRALFDVEVREKTIVEIREATNKSWVLGSDYIKEKIEDKINRSVKPGQKGGDRKSKDYRDSINQVCPL